MIKIDTFMSFWPKYANKNFTIIMSGTSLIDVFFFPNKFNGYIVSLCFY